MVIIIITLVSGYIGFFLPSQNAFLNEEKAEEMNEVAKSFLPTLEPDGQKLPVSLPKKALLKENEDRDEKEVQGNAKTNQSESKTIPLALIVGDKNWSIFVPEGSNAYQAMERLREQQGFSFNGKEHPGLGFFVEEIEGMKNNQNKSGMYWIYYVNGKKAEVGISQYIIQAGDTIEWKYEGSDN